MSNIDDYELKELYQAVVLENSKSPYNFGTIDGVNPIIGKNPSCGDKINLYVNKDNHHIKDLKFTGEGCALCIASASLMTQYLKNKSTDMVENTIDNFSELIHGNMNEMSNPDFEELNIFKNIHNFPTRAKCAMLPWRALEESLKNKG